MARIDADLEAKIRSDPKEPQRAVVVLAKGSKRRAAALGLTEASEVVPGVFTGSFTGEQLLALGQQEEVEEIVPDFDVQAL